MLEVFVVDSRAESRVALVDKILGFLDQESENLRLIPRVNVVPLSPEELNLHNAPDLCILGSALLAQELSFVSRIRKALPHTPLVAWTTNELEHLGIIEQLARMGVDDTLCDNTGSHEFLKKLVLLSRKRKKKHSGKLILVDSGKGGVGVTSIVAALGEALADQGKKTLLCDFDVESQDLSRFLQAKPYVNESLQHLFDGSRPLTSDYVTQTYTQVWMDEPNLFCMSPIAESEAFYIGSARFSRALFSVLEILDETFECIVIDIGSARGSLLQTLYRLADTVLFVLNNDPATLYASAERIRKARKIISADAEIMVIENGLKNAQLSPKVMREEFTRVTQIAPEEWSKDSIPFCAQANKWPGSGATLYSLGKSSLSVGLRGLLANLKLIEIAPKTLMPNLFARLGAIRKDYHSTIISRYDSTGRLELPARGSNSGAEAKESNPSTLSLLPEKTKISESIVTSAVPSTGSKSSQRGSEQEVDHLVTEAVI